MAISSNSSSTTCCFAGGNGWSLACVFAFAALANAWATRGRHFGWMALSAVVGLAVAGY